MSSGTIFQRESDQRWVARLTVAGKRLQRYAATEKEAKQRLKDLIAADATGDLVAPSRITLAAWVEQWLAAIEGEHRPSTLFHYRDVLRPVLAERGTARLDRLTPFALQVTFDHLRKQGKGTRRLQQAHVVLGTCLRRAVRLGLLQKSPLDRVAKPQHAPRHRRDWTLDEARRFLAIAHTTRQRYGPLFAFLLATGLRASEALGLTWGDVDLVQGVVHVRQALVYTAGTQPTLQNPKSEAGIRIVALPGDAVAALGRLTGARQREAFVFVTTTGTHPMLGTLRDALHRLCDRAGVPRVSPHALRHTHAAVLASTGIDPHSLRRRLGHSQVSTTMNIYAYALKPDTVAATAFDRVLNEP